MNNLEQIFNGLKTAFEGDLEDITKKCSLFETLVSSYETGFEKKFAGMKNSVKRIFSSKKKQELSDFKEEAESELKDFKKLYFLVSNRIKIDKIENDNERQAKAKSAEIKNHEKRLKDLYTQKNKLELDLQNIKKILGHNSSMIDKTFDDKKKKKLFENKTLLEKDIQDLENEISEKDKAITAQESIGAQLRKDLEEINKRWSGERAEGTSVIAGQHFTARMVYSELLKCLESCIKRLQVVVSKLGDDTKNKNNSRPRHIADTLRKNAKGEISTIGFGNDDMFDKEILNEKLTMFKNDFNKYKEVLEDRLRNLRFYYNRIDGLTRYFNTKYVNSELHKKYIEKLGNDIEKLKKLISRLNGISESPNPAPFMELLDSNKQEFEKSIEEYNDFIKACESQVSSMRDHGDEKLNKRLTLVKNFGSDLKKRALEQKKRALEKKRSEFSQKLKNYYIFDNNMGIDHTEVKNGNITPELKNKSGCGKFIIVNNAQPCLDVAKGQDVVLQWKVSRTDPSSWRVKGECFIIIDGNGQKIDRPSKGSVSDLSVNRNYGEQGRKEVKLVLMKSLQRGEWVSLKDITTREHNEFI